MDKRQLLANLLAKTQPVDLTNVWQSQYEQPDWRSKLTTLSPAEETQFQTWAQQNKVPITSDYDMRGFWKNAGESGINRNDGLVHYTDQYKTPLHESFSGESIYSSPTRERDQKPAWNPQDQLVDPSGKVLFDEPLEVNKRKNPFLFPVGE